MTPSESQPQNKTTISNESNAETDLVGYRAVRIEKLHKLESAGIATYPARHELISGRISSEFFRQKYDSVQIGEENNETIRFCGRLVARREMGKASFAHLQDFAGKLQIYVRKDTLGEEAYRHFIKDLDIGDILAVGGHPFRTKTGELSIKAAQVALLSKSLRPLPEKWHGLKDIETRSRHRELDLIANIDSRQIFALRSRIVQVLRSTLYQEGYLEVETPMMQSIPGGAVARPFETHHNALNQKFYLRVAPELYLKRCLVGEFPKVFELGRVFRNEGIDSLHNPEFTILEVYEAYGDMESMMQLSEILLHATATLAGGEAAELFKPPYKRATIVDLFRQYVGEKEADCVAVQNWDGLYALHGARLGSAMKYKVYDHLFDEKIAPHLKVPTFVIDFPADFSPLAKTRADNPNIAERFELYVHGQEVANAYSELNDPIRQRKALESYQSSRRGEHKDEESAGMSLDEAFIQALEQGMPPAGGLGIGVDRLVMMLSGQTSIRDVVLFPTLRSE